MEMTPFHLLSFRPVKEVMHLSLEEMAVAEMTMVEVTNQIQSPLFRCLL